MRIFFLIFILSCICIEARAGDNLRVEPSIGYLYPITIKKNEIGYFRTNAANEFDTTETQKTPGGVVPRIAIGNELYGIRLSYYSPPKTKISGENAMPVGWTGISEGNLTQFGYGADVYFRVPIKGNFDFKIGAGMEYHKVRFNYRYYVRTAPGNPIETDGRGAMYASGTGMAPVGYGSFDWNASKNLQFSLEAGSRYLKINKFKADKDFSPYDYEDFVSPGNVVYHKGDTVKSDDGKEIAMDLSTVYATLSMVFIF